jgi:Zn-dependent protease
MLDVTSGSSVTTMFASILIFLVIIGFIISMHEAAHAFMANRLGDPTARLLGRMTLNPVNHIDPIGTLILPFILLLLKGPVFGWAKPTPINPFNFQHPRRDTAIVAFAGPASNFTLAFLIGILSRLLPIATSEKTAILSSALNFQSWTTLFSLISGNFFSLLFFLLSVIIVLNLLLGIFNLIPIPPLDGSKILAGVLPKEAAVSFSALESYGPVLLLVLLFILLPILSPIIFTILNFFLRIFAGVTI